MRTPRNQLSLGRAFFSGMRDDGFPKIGYFGAQEFGSMEKRTLGSGCILAAMLGSLIGCMPTSRTTAAYSTGSSGFNIKV